MDLGKVICPLDVSVASSWMPGMVGVLSLILMPEEYGTRTVFRQPIVARISVNRVGGKDVPNTRLGLRCRAMPGARQLFGFRNCALKLACFVPVKLPPLLKSRNVFVRVHQHIALQAHQYNVSGSQIPLVYGMNRKIDVELSASEERRDIHAQFSRHIELASGYELMVTQKAMGEIRRRHSTHRFFLRLRSACEPCGTSHYKRQPGGESDT